MIAPCTLQAPSSRFGAHELVPNITFGCGRACHQVPYDVMVSHVSFILYFVDTISRQRSKRSSAVCP